MSDIPKSEPIEYIATEPILKQEEELNIKDVPDPLFNWDNNYQTHNTVVGSEQVNGLYNRNDELGLKN